MDLEKIEFNFNIPELGVAINTTKTAGQLIRGNSNLQSTKSGLEFKAAIDDLANKTIVAKIKERFPNDAILTEELEFPQEASDRLWVVDPVDGTTNYLNGLRMYTCLISYIEKGKTVVSVAYLPQSDEMIVAITGKGVFLNNKKIDSPNENRPIGRANIVLDPGYDPEGGNKVAETFKKLRPQVGNIAMFNGNGYTLSLMALGEVAGVVHFSSKVWEVAGLHILEESGGKVTDFGGNPLVYDFQKPSAFQFIASRGIDHEDLRKLVISKL